MKLSVKQQRALIPDSEIKVAFMKRGDIKTLSSTEREARWREHKKHVDKFRQFLAGVDALVVGEGD